MGAQAARRREGGVVKRFNWNLFWNNFAFLMGLYAAMIFALLGEWPRAGVLFACAFIVAQFPDA